MGTKAVRFSDKEEKDISEFLEMNPFLDFSTLARLSIMSFIENPEIKLKAVLPSKNIDKNKHEKVRIH
jgi:hypothetical protein